MTMQSGSEPRYTADELRLILAVLYAVAPPPNSLELSLRTIKKTRAMLAATEGK